MSLTITPQQPSTTFNVTKSWYKLIRILLPVVLGVVYLTHLGHIPLDIESDEAKRAVVSAEMILSGNYVTPTINGEPYLNKPPLYNYIVAGYFNLFGNYSMFVFRLQVIVAIFLTGLLIYYFTKKYTNYLVAFFTAMAYMTNGRLLIYESLFGMIDATFALVVFANSMIIFHFGQQKKYNHLFILSYLACALGFFLKGLPALVFQCITLTSYFLLTRDFKKIFSRNHFYGLLLFSSLLAVYYIMYFTDNDVTVAALFKTLYTESEKRTFLVYDLKETLTHIIIFPFEILYHFLPWTLFLITLFRKNSLRLLNLNPFIQYITWIFLANIVVYWLSVDVYPKYLFMFVPLLYAAAFYFYFNHAKTWHVQFIKITFTACLLLMCIASIALPFTGLTDKGTDSYWQFVLLSIGFIICTVMMIRNRYGLYFFMLALVLARAGFNWFVVEQRGSRFFAAERIAKTITDLTRNKQLFIMDDADTGNFDGLSFEIATGRNEILSKTSDVVPGAYYIVDERQLKEKKYAVDLAFENLPFHNKLYLVH